MPKFFADPENITAGRAVLTGVDAAHIARVLRGGPGDVYIIGDGRGRDYECEITGIEKNKDSVAFAILRELPADYEPAVRITLYQALPKLDKMDSIIQKCVELGVARIVPVISENTVVRTGGGAKQKRDRWRKIAEAAAKQSMRGIIPEVAEIVPLKEAVAGGAFPVKGFDDGEGAASRERPGQREELRFAPYEGEKTTTIKSLLRRDACAYNGAGFFIGPEGGFSEGEIRLFRENGIGTVTLGPRILRTETAGAAVLAMLLYEWEL